MPYLQLDLPFAVADRTALAGALIDAYVRCMQSDVDRVSIAFRELGPDGVLRRVDGALVPAVVLACDVRSGRPEGVIAAFMEAATALLADRLGIPPARVAVYITEHRGAEIARGGRTTSDWSPNRRDAR